MQELIEEVHALRHRTALQHERHSDQHYSMIDCFPARHDA